MKLKETLSELKKLGTAQNRKIYGRHGVSGEMYGVSYANLGKLEKKIGIDHDLAIGLWDSGIHDAMVLATFVADPAKLKITDANRWVKQVPDSVLGGAFSKLIAQTDFATKKANQWIKSRDEWISTVGWGVLNQIFLTDIELPESELISYLKTIEKDLHNSPNQTRYTMNNCLIAIGLRNVKLQKMAIAAAKKIGVVEVDHGETSCKTPDAIAYIKKTLDYRKRKASKKVKKTSTKKVKKKASTG